MSAYERLYTRVFEKLGRTIYIDAMWRMNKVGFYLEQKRSTFSIGFLLFEFTFYKWGE